jgi:cytochrome c biogenesis protein CcmG, thiol:disulfide interchange protein DsbE
MPSRGSLRWLLLLSASLTGGCALPSHAASPDEEAGEHSLVGAPAPAFDLPAQAGGERAALASLRGKAVLVDFWATWCEPCRASFPRYEALAKKYGDRLAIVGISEDDDPDGIASFARDTGVTFVLAWDRDKAVAGAYRPSAMPTTYLVDGNGLVRYVHAGYRHGDEAILESRIEDILQ